MTVYICAQNSTLGAIQSNWRDSLALCIPLALMIRFTVSTTSTKASFFLYLTSVRRQLIAPVAWVVIFEDSSWQTVETALVHNMRNHTMAAGEARMLSVVM